MSIKIAVDDGHRKLVYIHTLHPAIADMMAKTIYHRTKGYDVDYPEKASDAYHAMCDHLCASLDMDPEFLIEYLQAYIKSGTDYTVKSRALSAKVKGDPIPLEDIVRPPEE